MGTTVPASASNYSAGAQSAHQMTSETSVRQQAPLTVVSKRVPCGANVEEPLSMFCFCCFCWSHARKCLLNRQKEHTTLPGTDGVKNQTRQKTLAAERKESILDDERCFVETEVSTALLAEMYL